MARSVTFNGITLFHPGGITRVNATSLAAVGLTQTGVVGIIGESNGGPSGELVTIDDPALALPTFGTGPIADAVRIAFDPSNDPRIPGGAFRCIVYKTNTSTQSTCHLPGDDYLVSDTADAGATTTVIPLVTGGLVADAHIGRWFQIGSNKRRIVDNAAASITVQPGFPSAPTAATVVHILDDEIVLTSTGYGLDQNQLTVEFEPGVATNTFVMSINDSSGTVNVSPELGGNPYLYIKYLGGPIPTHGTGDVTVATTTLITVDVDSAPTLNAFAGMVLQFSNGLQRLIVGNTAADPTAITISQALTTAEAAEVVGLTATVRNVTTATATVGGASGAATTFSTTVLPTADDLSITFSANQTLRNFVDYINANTNFEAVIPDGINANTTLMKTFDFGTRATAVDVRFDSEVTPADKGTFRRDLQQAVDWVNDFATLATAVRASAGATEGGEIPSFTGGSATLPQDLPIYFVGGDRGTSTNSDWQTAFDEFLTPGGRVNQIVPLISYDLEDDGFGSTATFAAVAAQLGDHVSQCRGLARSERGGYIGGDLTKSELIAQAAALNNTDVQLFGQKLTVVDATGNLVEQPEWSMAVNAAGMRSGASEVGTPLTYKFLKTTALSQSSTWNPGSRTDVNALIQGGVMFAEQLQSGGFRYVRDETTYLIDDNIAFVDGNTRDAVRFVAYDLRTDLENFATGNKLTVATVTGVRARVVQKMQLYLDQNIIVTSLDPETLTTLLPGYRNLRVFGSGNVITVRIEIFPCVGVLFELIDISLMIPQIAA